MKKVVITGAGGFIGGALTNKLLKEGLTVYGVDVSTDKLQRFSSYSTFIPILADFSAYESLANKINDSNIDVFYHFAWHGVFGVAFDDYTLQLSNANYSCVAMEQAVRLKAKKFVFAGTKNEIEVQGLMKRDDIAPRSTCIYSTAKQAAEMICKTLAYKHGIEYSAGLVAMAYGELNYSKMLVNVVIENILRGERPKLATGLQPYDLIYISDIAEAFKLIGERGKNLKSYYVGHRKLKSFRQIVKDIRNVIAPSMKLIFGEFSDSTDIDYSDVDLDALFKDTGFECSADFKQSILATAGWIASNIPVGEIKVDMLGDEMRSIILNMSTSRRGGTGQGQR